jgi:hypothetical protein
MAAFMPGESPPEVNTAMRFIFFFIEINSMRIVNDENLIMAIVRKGGCENHKHQGRLTGIQKS